MAVHAQHIIMNLLSSSCSSRLLQWKNRKVDETAELTAVLSSNIIYNPNSFVIHSPDINIFSQIKLCPLTRISEHLTFAATDSTTTLVVQSLLDFIRCD